jgi:hypothetical protein
VPTASTILKGSLTISIDNTTAFLADTSAQDATKKAIASVATISHTLVDVSYEVVNNRRLQGSRMLSAGSILASYTITVPQNHPTSVASILGNVQAASQSQWTTAIASKLAESGLTYAVQVTHVVAATVVSTSPTVVPPTNTQLLLHPIVGGFDDDDNSVAIALAIILPILVVIMSFVVLGVYWHLRLKRRSGEAVEVLMLSRDDGERSEPRSQQPFIAPSPLDQERGDGSQALSSGGGDEEKERLKSRTGTLVSIQSASKSETRTPTPVEIANALLRDEPSNSTDVAELRRKSEVEQRQALLAGLGMFQEAPPEPPQPEGAQLQYRPPELPEFPAMVPPVPPISAVLESAALATRENRSDACSTVPLSMSSVDEEIARELENQPRSRTPTKEADELVRQELQHQDGNYSSRLSRSGEAKDFVTLPPLPMVITTQMVSQETASSLVFVENQSNANTPSPPPQSTSFGSKGTLTLPQPPHAPPPSAQRGQSSAQLQRNESSDWATPQPSELWRLESYYSTALNNTEDTRDDEEDASEIKDTPRTQAQKVLNAKEGWKD